MTMLTMSNPGLHLAVIGNPGPRTKRRASTRRSSSKKGSKMARLTKKRAKALCKATRALGRRPSAKLLRAANPGTPTGARKARRKKAVKTMRRRRTAAKKYRDRLRGYKVVVRRRAGKRKSNKAWGRKKRIRTGRKGTISFRKPIGRGKFKRVATNPRRKSRRRMSRRRMSRRSNPAISIKGALGGLTGLPANLQAIFKGKDMAPNVGFALGGAVGAMVAGDVLRGVLSKVIPVTMQSNRMVNGVIGFGTTYASGYAIAQLLIKQPRRRNAFITGTAIASIMNALMPGMLVKKLTAIPGIGPMLTKLPGMDGLGYYPSNALAAYVEAPGYQGTNGMGEYVSAKGYQAVGYDPAVAGDALAGELGTYVEANAYQAVGDIGMYGSSFLD